MKSWPMPSPIITTCCMAWPPSARFLTSFYMFRLTYLTFYGRSRMDHHTEEHVHESPMVMIGPLMVLRRAVRLGGFLGFPPEHGWLHQFLASGRRGRRRA